VLSDLEGGEGVDELALGLAGSPHLLDLLGQRRRHLGHADDVTHEGALADSGLL